MRSSPVKSIKKTADFKQVYNHGKSFSNRYFVLYASPNDRGLARLGLSIGKKVGKAVVRNKIRRWIKECFRLNKFELPSVDFVIIARMSAAGLVNDAKFSEVDKSIKALLEQLRAAL